jgi:hypothetical protein
MTGLLLFRRQLVLLMFASLVPGLSAFLYARHEANSAIQTSERLNVDGLATNQDVIDIGRVWSGGAGVHREFTLENRTGHKITIESVESDCSCTVPNIGTSELQNGASTKISVIFWPPTAANDLGGEFRRTITVAAATNDGPKSIRFELTGFVEPDATLRVFPVNVQIDSGSTTTQPSVILHFKGSASLLATVPDTLLVLPGQNARIRVQAPPSGQVEAIVTKDVQIKLPPDASFNNCGNWVSAITFAPDQISDGLTVHVYGRGPSIVATPSRLLLTDNPSGQNVTVRFSNRTGHSLLPISVDTDLPLVWNAVRSSSDDNGACTLRLGVRRPLSSNLTGTLRVRFSSLNVSCQMISIPVVMLHCEAQATSKADELVP